MAYKEYQKIQVFVNLDILEQKVKIVYIYKYT